MRVAVSGASGLIGRALVRELVFEGHDVIALQRQPAPVAAGVEGVPWPRVPSVGDGARRLAGLDALVHLAGSPIADGRWTDRRKGEIAASRGPATHQLLAALAAAGTLPRTFLCASAVGYYGACGDEPVDELSPAGTDFLSRVCVDWEVAAEEAAAWGVRVVELRTGVVLSPEGGMLARLMPFFRLGLGGPVGSGQQWLPWISLADEVGAIRTLLEFEQAVGPYNLTAPAPVRSREFAKALARVLHRPAAVALPASLVRLAFGEMGEAALLAGQRALPHKLAAIGYRFHDADLDSALASCLSR